MDRRRDDIATYLSFFFVTNATYLSYLMKLTFLELRHIVMDALLC